MHDHPRRPLHQRLDHHCRDLPPMRLQSARHFVQAGHRAAGTGESERASVTMWARSTQSREEQRAERGVKPLDASHAHIPQRVSVIGVTERQEERPLRLGLGLLPPVLERHLERDSTAVAPSSEKNTRDSPAGASSTSRRAS